MCSFMFNVVVNDVVMIPEEEMKRIINLRSWHLCSDHVIDRKVDLFLSGVISVMLLMLPVPVTTTHGLYHTDDLCFEEGAGTL